MIVLGLTGSIAMGKSTVAAMFREEGADVFDADAAVHRLMRPGGAAFDPISKAFPGCIEKGGIDRRALGRAVFGSPGKLRQLEGIVHPLVGAARREWLRDRRIRGAPLAVMDVPLLLEDRPSRYCDAVAVVSAPRWHQRRRAMSRPGMTESKLRGILAGQLDDEIKRRRADFVIPTGKGLRTTRRHVRMIAKSLMRQARRAPPDG